MSSLQCSRRRNSTHETDSTRICIPAKGIHMSLKNSCSIGLIVSLSVLAGTASEEPAARSSQSDDHEYCYLLEREAV
jgi:hypothetical protein